MRRTILSLMAVLGGLWSGTAPGLADEYNPFAEAVSLQESAEAPPAAPEPLPSEELLAPQPVMTPEAHWVEGGHIPHEATHGHHEYEHFEHHVHHADHHDHHAHEHEHEEIGNIRITPLYREIESDIWDAVFDSMYSINVGTTFWQPEHHHHNFNTQVGLVTEFQYSALEGRDTILNSVVSVPFAIRENVRVGDGDIYAGNIGLSFVLNTYLPDSCTKLEWGVSPLLTIGNLSADLERSPAAGITPGSIVLDRRASDNGTLVGGDFRVWTGIKTESGFRAGLTGFYGVAETDAIFDSSQTFNTYGGGLYVELPTRFVPHEFPAPTGAFQWIEEIFHLH